jgi:serine/threonine protein kinase
MLQTGTVLQGRFLIEQQLAQGGMGAVYLATDQKFGSRVAIKERIYEHAELAQAFEREARILNTLHHPILPHVSDYFSEPGGHFLVMEYIEGEDLCEKLKAGGNYPVTIVIGWAMELLDGLDYLHSQDPPIIHRDIKPGNLKLTTRGNIVLLDFGLAKESSGNTQGVRSVFGYSRRYSPLEQIEGAGTDVRSDIFSLGATLFHLITGEPPVDVLARASAIVAGRPDPLKMAHEARPEVPVGISHVLQTALALDPERRFSSAAEMRSALAAALQEGTEAADISAVVPAANDIDEVDTLLATAAGEDRGPILSDVTEAMPVITQDRKRVSRALFRPQAPIQRSGFWLALLVIALLGIGYAGLRSFRLSDSNTSPEMPVEAERTQPEASQPVADQTSVQEANSPSAEPAEDLSKSIPDSKGGTGGGVRKKEVTRAGENKRMTSSEEDSSGRRPSENGDQQKESLADSRRSHRTLVRPQRQRSVPRGEPIFGPPVSTIETIFTGIPPSQRRRYRRIYPY